MHNILVREWMTAHPIVAASTTTLPEALELMQVNNIRRLPICEEDRLIGIVTKGDLRGAQPSEATSLSIFELNYLVGRITLGQIMTHQPIVVTPTTTIYEAAKIMLQRKVSGLPVMDDGRLVGIITESDIFRMVVRTWPEPQPEDRPVLQSA
jgi:acetoin utilization protein AcuB